MAVKWITNPDTLIGRPEIYPLSLDAAQKRVIFAHVAREQFASAPFHDRSLVTSSGQKWAASLADLMAWGPELAGKITRRPRYIFHTSYCGSTLLARALDEPGKCLVVREPEILYALRMLRFRIDSGDQTYLADWRRLWTAVIPLLSRSFTPDEQVVVKLAAEDSYVMGTLLEPGTAGLFLYNDLPGHLTAVLKSTQRRQKFHKLAKMYAGFSAAHGTLPPVETAELDDAQAAAYVWLWHAANFQRQGGETPSLASGDFFAQTVAAVTAVAHHFALPFSRTDVEAVTSGPVFQTDAKAVRGGLLGRGLRKVGGYRRVERWLWKRPFTETERRQTARQQSEALQAEIEDGVAWAQSFDIFSPGLRAIQFQLCVNPN